MLLMLVCGGLFAGSVLTLAWNRMPVWKHMPFPQFLADFEHTISVADKLQPFLLVTTIIATSLFALNASGLAKIFAFVAVAGFLLILIASAAILVPLQRQILSTKDESVRLEAMRSKWLTGHAGRTILSVVSFALTTVAVAA